MLPEDITNEKFALKDVEKRSKVHTEEMLRLVKITLNLLILLQEVRIHNLNESIKTVNVKARI